MARRNTDSSKTSQLRLFADANAPDVSTEKHASTVCVFCGSSPGNDPVYAEAARRLGALLGENGYRLLFGGGGLGLMGEVARAARAADAPVIGILPAFLRHLEPPLEFGEKIVITADLHQRKSRMVSLSDAFVLLPGGLGTFDEFFEVVTSAQLSVHEKPIVLINTRRYFAPLQSLLEHVVTQGFARSGIASLYSIVDTPEEAIDLLNPRLAEQPRHGA